jgi:hypothetical protein
MHRRGIETCSPWKSSHLNEADIDTDPTAQEVIDICLTEADRHHDRRR